MNEEDFKKLVTDIEQLKKDITNIKNEMATLKTLIDDCVSDTKQVTVVNLKCERFIKAVTDHYLKTSFLVLGLIMGVLYLIAYFR